MRFLLATSNSDSSVFLTVPTPVGNSSFRAISDGLTAQNIYSLLVSHMQWNHANLYF